MANESKDYKDLLYLQLHEQYAINNNANLSTIMALVIALIGVIGYYGYVFINTTNEFNWKSFQLYDPYKNGFSTEALILVCIASISILAILFCLCTFQGIAQRKEQFIIHEIRCKYGIDKESILPKTYNPYFKIDLATIQGIYGEFVMIFRVVFYVLIVATIIRILAAGFIGKASCEIWIEIIILVITSIIVYVCCFCYYNFQYSSYIERQIEFINKHTEELISEKGQMKTIKDELDKIIGNIDSNKTKTYKDNVDKLKRKVDELREEVEKNEKLRLSKQRQVLIYKL